MLFDELNEENFILFASKYYTNSRCIDVNEFNEDVNRIKYIKRLFTRYTQDDDLQERLILNHLITLYNIFDVAACNRMLLYKIPMEQYPILKTFLIYLEYVDENFLTQIPLDPTIVEKLRAI